MYYTSWGIIIDDIVFPDGRTSMGVLGGGGLYSVAGMRIWSANVGILSNVDADFDPGILDGLDLCATDLRITGRPTPRAWQLFEEDGLRTQIPRIPLTDWTTQLAYPADLAEQLQAQGVRAVHLLSRGLPNDPDMIARIALSGIRISLEPIIEDGMDAAHRERVLGSLPYVEIFSPGIGELRVLMGDLASGPALVAIAERGPAIVALRRGAAGSLVYQRDSRRMLRVPAARASVVDVTGAGNAYAGGMLVAWCESSLLELAAAAAAVSAALTIEQIVPPKITPALLAEAQQRRTQVLAELSETDGNDDS
jgi:sugar/nucleoside kinase (ribokinase family)